MQIYFYYYLMLLELNIIISIYLSMFVYYVLLFSVSDVFKETSLFSN